MRVSGLIPTMFLLGKIGADKSAQLVPIFFGPSEHLTLSRLLEYCRNAQSKQNSTGEKTSGSIAQVEVIENIAEKKFDDLSANAVRLLSAYITCLNKFDKTFFKRTMPSRILNLLHTINTLFNLLADELDPKKEFNNLQKVYKLSSNSPSVTTPQPISYGNNSFQMSRVLGSPVSKLVTSDSNTDLSEEDASRLIQELLQFQLSLLFQEGLVHGDPHPGNVHINILSNNTTQKPSLGIVDFGCVIELNEEQTQYIKEFLLYMIFEINGNQITYDPIENLLKSFAVFPDQYNIADTLLKKIYDKLKNIKMKLINGENINFSEELFGIFIPIVKEQGRISKDFFTIFRMLGCSFDTAKSIHSLSNMPEESFTNCFINQLATAMTNAILSQQNTTSLALIE